MRDCLDCARRYKGLSSFSEMYIPLGEGKKAGGLGRGEGDGGGPFSLNHSLSACAVAHLNVRAASAVK